MTGLVCFAAGRCYGAWKRAGSAKPLLKPRRDPTLLASVLASVSVVGTHVGQDGVGEGGWLSTQTTTTAFASIPWIQR